MNTETNLKDNTGDYLTLERRGPLLWLSFYAGPDRPAGYVVDVVELTSAGVRALRDELNKFLEGE